MTDSWEALSPLLANAGYCVYALNYGGSSASNPIQATGPIETSAQQLSAFVNQVLAATACPQGRHRRAFAGRHDAALLHPLPRRRGQGQHPRRARPEQPRHHAFRADHARVGVRRQRCASRHARPAASRWPVRLPGQAERGPRDRARSALHGHREPIRRRRHARTRARSSRPGRTSTTSRCRTAARSTLGDHLAIIYDAEHSRSSRNALDPAHPVAVPCTLVLPGNGAIARR